MKTFKLNYFIGFMAIALGAMIFYSCEENIEIDSTRGVTQEIGDDFQMKTQVVQDAFTVSSINNGGGGTSCQVSCFWGSCDAQCDAGEVADCYCSWGSPECHCSGGGATSAIKGYNPQKTYAFIEFVSSNNFQPVVAEVIMQLGQVIESENWEAYDSVREQYIATMESLPQYQQQMVIEYLESN